MKRRLERVLRVRRLEEEMAQLEYAAQRAEVQRLQEASRRQHELARSVRASAWIRVEEETTAEWLLDVADADLLAWRGEQLAASAERRRREAEAARAALLEKRLERRQLELLAASAKRAAAQETIRREQKSADDWFQNTRRRSR